ncbi:MAG: hypothetical protein Q9173_003254 [Seirophora scorigena]
MANVRNRNASEQKKTASLNIDSKKHMHSSPPQRKTTPAKTKPTNSFIAHHLPHRDARTAVHLIGLRLPPRPAVALFDETLFPTDYSHLKA